MKPESLIPKLVRACLDNNHHLVEEISALLVRLYKKTSPDIAKDISKALTYTKNGSSPLRSIGIQPLPLDKESRLSLGRIEEQVDILPPILSTRTMDELSDFINEREKIDILIHEEITPPNSMLFIGPPGVGKTYTARWLSNKLGLPLVLMDIATSISSYLGRSGQNLKELFDYARTSPSILFLDELDAIAKRRDDISDLGELKRLVNVLLKEMEIWSSQSIIIAATNHPELLDKAIWRRFDRVIHFPLPGTKERKELITRTLGRFEKKLTRNVLNFFVSQSNAMNAADICKTCTHIMRKSVMETCDVSLIAIEKVCELCAKSKESKIKICQTLKDSFPDMSGREISRITKIPVSSVSRYIQVTCELDNEQ